MNFTSLTNPPVGNFVIHGAAIGLDTLEGLRFRLDKHFTYCRICGEVYQSDYDRYPEIKLSNWLPTIEDVERFALLMRKEWSQTHAKEHPEREHANLVASGRFYTPEAAIKLAAFGVISVIDLAIDDEVESALRESSPIPKDDARDR